MHLSHPTFAALFILSHVGSIQAVTYSCSSQNTGSSFNAVYNMYQSQGACQQTCAGYAFEILQGFQCWCSNYFPAADVSTSECNTSCPGFDTDNCGGTLNGVYAYYQLAQASGTQQLSSSAPAATSSTASTTSSRSTSSTSTKSTSSTSTSAPTVAAPVTVVVTQTATPSPVTSSTASASTSGTSTGPVTVYINSFSSSPRATSTSRSTSTSSSRSGAAASSTANLETSGQEQLSAQSNNGFFHSPGKVAGTFVAVGLVVLALVALFLFFLLRRRRQGSAESAMAVEKLNRKESSSSTLEEQSAVADGRSRSGSTSGLMAYGQDKQGRGSPNGIIWPSENGEIVPIDQRLNPQPMLMRFDSNYSRHSLRDDEDYSRRVLTVANPGAD